IEAIARGGVTTAAGIRLRCRAHNLYAAECTFGAEFMRGKREEAQRQAAEAKSQRQSAARDAARVAAEARARAKAEEMATAAAAAATAREKDVIPWLRQLGYGPALARRGAESCAHLPDASLEERVKVACRSLASRCVQQP